MNVEATKLELMQMLLNTNKEKVLLQLKAILDRENKQETAIREEMLESAKRSNEDIRTGNVYSPEEVERLLEKRFGA